MPLSDEKVLQQARSRYQVASQFAESWRKSARQAFDYVASHQISEEDRRELEKNKRPIAVFNLIAPNIKAISGMERGNRHEIKFLAREEDEVDGWAAAIFNQTSRWIFDRNDNEYHESGAFRDMTICGMGWTQLRVDYDEDPQGKVNAPTIDPLRKLWDPSAKAENLSDRRYDFTEVRLDEDEFRQMFPDFSPNERPAGTVFGDTFDESFEAEALQENKPDQYADAESDEGAGSQALAKIPVLEYNFWIFEDVYQLRGESGEVIDEFTNAERGNAMMEAGQPVVKLTGQRRYYKAWFNGNDLIEQQESADPRSFTEHCLTGEYDRSKGHWHGVVRDMIDPQMWANKLFMQLLHIVNTNAKGGFFFTKGAFANKKKALADWAQGDRGIEVNAQAGDIRSAIMERSPAPLPQSMHELLLFVTGIIPRVSGFNMELLGMAEKDQPGILEHMRKQAGMTILAPFFDALRHYRQMKAKTLIHFINAYIPDRRIARILDADTRQAFQQGVLRGAGVEKFDVVVEEAPHSPNLKTANFAMLQEWMQTNPELGQLIFDLVLEQSPVPQDLQQKIAQRLQQSRQPDPAQQAAQQAEIRKTISEAEENEAGALLDRVKAATEQAKTRLAEEGNDLEEMNIIADFISTIQQARANQGQELIKALAQQQRASSQSNGSS